MSRNLRRPSAVLAILLAGFATGIAREANDLGPDPKEVRAVVEKAAAYLKSRQGSDGSFSPKIAGPGVSAIVAAGLLRNGISEEDPMVAKTLAFVETKVKKDGGIYDKGLANYTTSVALMAFRDANANGKYDTVIENAAAFLKKLQFDEARATADDPKFGGVGYDGGKRPDLSNTQYFVDALLAAGVPKDDPAVHRALKFVSRCQNLPGETNDLPFAKKTTADDRGGFTYTPLDPDDNPHKTADGGLRSLGAMTYGGLKSFLYAGVSKDDPRVQGAVKWMRSHYTLEENPGMGQAGIFYYYHTFGKAMQALDENRFVDAKGKKHDWRKELFEAIEKRQRPDGSFINAGDKTFGEADQNLATGFALLTLSYTRPAKK